MSQGIAKGNLIRASSKLTRSPRTVLLRMAADQERADRIRQIKQDNPGLKWRHIADHVGVELRSAQMWQETGAISYENAKKLAELVDVSVDWIMRGTPSSTPSPFPEPTLESELGNVLQEIKAQLAEQTRVLDEIKDYARRVEQMLSEQRDLKDETDELVPLMRAVLDGRPLEGEAARGEARESPAPAKK